MTIHIDGIVTPHACLGSFKFCFTKLRLTTLIRVSVQYHCNRQITVIITSNQWHDCARA
jgi:hypothetical protein